MALVVRDYDEAIAWFTDKLDFELVADEQQSETKRWVLVRPPGTEMHLLLARAATPQQEQAIGNQTGGRVFMFLQTDDFDRDFAKLRARGVDIIRPPKTEPYGKVAVFADLSGNHWDLVEFTT